MPRYYFNARGPNRYMPDYHGLELSDLLTARAVALLAAAEVLDEETASLPRHPDWRFEITDEAGRTILTIPFSQAARPDASGRA